MRTIALACLFVLCLCHAVPARLVAVDPITEWSQAASAAAEVGGMSPVRSSITLAIVHVAMFDAVTAIAGGRRPHALGQPASGAASAYAAAVEAGYRVLVAEFPSQHDVLHRTYVALLTAEQESAEKRAGVQVGADVARRMLASRAGDGRNRMVPYASAQGASAWLPTPPEFLAVTTAFLSTVTPLTLDNPSQFRPSGPPHIGSAQWAAEYNEVKAMGARHGASRNRAQTETALFWEAFAGTVWIPAIRRLAREHRLDLEASARFQAAAFTAFADALIACWDAKLHFNFWRPVTAIHNGDADLSAATEADPRWESLAVTPNFPEYPSGHACTSAAVAHTIEYFFSGGVRIPVRNATTGEERVYRGAAAVVDEVIEARMLLGVHFRSANQDGAEIGRKIAAHIRREWLQ